MKQILKLTFVAMLGGMISLVTYKSFVEEPQAIEATDEKPKFNFTNYSGSPSVPLENLDFVKASKMTVDAVVHVKTVFRSENVYNPWSRYFGVPSQPRQQMGTGSGVIISGDGYIVTNNHVVDNAEEIQISTNDNRSYEATLIGTDPATDLALLKIEEKGLPAIILGDSDNLQIGEWVIAVGNPFNLTSTVTAGIVSAKARNINILDYDPSRDVFPLESFIQTDAAVNPGNSGGALVNGRGELIGINTAIASRTGSYSGYSFAIPVSIVKKVTADIIEFGKVQRAYIGVNISNIDQESREKLDLKVSEGALVRGLMDGGAAASAGLEENDVITRVEGIRVENVTQLQEQVGKFRPGDKINVEVLRNNQYRDFKITLRDRYGNTELKKSNTENLEQVFGATLEPLPDDFRERYRLKGGVKVKELREGKLRSAGLTEGFIITHINKEAVHSPEEVSAMLRNKKGGVLVEGVHKNGRPDYFGFGL